MIDLVAHSLHFVSTKVKANHILVLIFLSVYAFSSGS